MNQPTLTYTEISEREIELGWTATSGEEKQLAFLCTELVDLMHEHFDLGHELINCSYDTLGNYSARIIQDGIEKRVHLATYTRDNAIRKQRKLIPLLEKIHEEMTIEDFVMNQV